MNLHTSFPSRFIELVAPWAEECRDTGISLKYAGFWKDRFPVPTSFFYTIIRIGNSKQKHILQGFFENANNFLKPRGLSASALSGFWTINYFLISSVQNTDCMIAWCFHQTKRWDPKNCTTVSPLCTRLGKWPVSLSIEWGCPSAGSSWWWLLILLGALHSYPKLPWQQIRERFSEHSTAK